MGGLECVREDEYPDDAELDKIKSWPTEDIMGLVYHTMDLWHWRDMARLSHGDPATLELHTGGWSGNEDIIDKLSDTLFWMICWESTRRGGHYYFEIPKYLQGGE